MPTYSTSGARGLRSFFFFSSRRRHTRCSRDWSSDVCSSDLFNVSLPELKTERLHFLGGRISHLREIEVAALEYRVDGDNVSLFIIPEEGYPQLPVDDKPPVKVVSHRRYDVVVLRCPGARYTP